MTITPTSRNHICLSEEQTTTDTGEDTVQDVELQSSKLPTVPLPNHDTPRKTAAARKCTNKPCETMKKTWTTAGEHRGQYLHQILELHMLATQRLLEPKKQAMLRDPADGCSKTFGKVSKQKSKIQEIQERK